MIDLKRLQQLLETLRKGPITPAIVKEIQQINSQIQQHQQNKNSGKQKKKTASDVIKEFQEIHALLKKHKGDLKKSIDVDQEQLRYLIQEKNMMKDYLKREAEAGNLFGAGVLKAQERVKILSKTIKQKQDFAVGQEKGQAAAKNLLQRSLGLQTEWGKLGAKGAKGMATGFAKGIFKSANLVGLLVSLAEKVISQILAADSASADLYRTTGVQFGTFKDGRKKEGGSLVDMAAESGLMVKDLQGKYAKTFQELIYGYKNFDELLGKENKSLRHHLGATMVTLKLLGASDQDTVKSFGFLVKTLGKTPKQAADVMNNFKGIADALGRPTREIAKDFAANSPILARFGDNSEKIFKEASFQAAQIEMDTAKLLSLGDQMDTFDGAAKAAQSFNIALGGPFLQAHALLNASVPEKLKLIKDAYDRSGQKPLSQRMLRALSAELNMSAAELQRALNIDTKKFKTKKAKLDNAQSSLQENMSAVNANQSLMDKLAGMMEKLITKLTSLIGGEAGLSYVSDILTKIAMMFMGEKDENFAKQMQEKAKIKDAGGLVKRVVNSQGQQVIMTKGQSKSFNDRMRTMQEFMKLEADKKKGIVSDEGYKIRKADIEDYAENKLGIISKQLIGMSELARLSEGDTTKMAAAYKELGVIGKGFMLNTGVDAKTFAFFEKNQKAFLEEKKISNKVMDRMNTRLDIIGLESGGLPTNIMDARDTAKDMIRQAKIIQRQAKKGQSIVPGIQFSIADDETGDIGKFIDSEDIETVKVKKPKKKPKVKKFEDALVSPMDMPQNYVQPVFNKKDTFIAAKEGGIITNALDELVKALNILAEQKPDLNLDISERDLAQTVDSAFAALKNRSL